MNGVLPKPSRMQRARALPEGRAARALRLSRHSSRVPAFRSSQDQARHIPAQAARQRTENRAASDRLRPALVLPDAVAQEMPRDVCQGARARPSIGAPAGSRIAGDTRNGTSTRGSVSDDRPSLAWTGPDCFLADWTVQPSDFIELIALRPSVQGLKAKNCWQFEIPLFLRETPLRLRPEAKRMSERLGELLGIDFRLDRLDRLDAANKIRGFWSPISFLRIRLKGLRLDRALALYGSKCRDGEKRRRPLTAIARLLWRIGGSAEPDRGQAVRAIASGEKNTSRVNRLASGPAEEASVAIAERGESVDFGPRTSSQI